MKYIKKAIYIFLPLILGTIVGILTKDSMDYEYLIQPLLAPPAILFPIIWTIIYLLLGISYYLYKKETLENNIDGIYYLELAVNLIWPIIFFVLKLRFIAIIWIILLDLLVIYMLRIMFKYYPKSGYLNILYLSWILFATYLTFSIYLLN